MWFLFWKKKKVVKPVSDHERVLRKINAYFRIETPEEISDEPDEQAS